jgi:DNA mismatch repair protein MutS2
VLTVIGESQDLQSDRSTFSGHVERLLAVLDVASSRDLVLLDELAVGTAPRQGAALAMAILEDLAERCVTSVVTTHYDRLKTLSLEDPRFQNASVGTHAATGEPSYELAQGHPGASSGLDMASKLGIAPAIIERARAILGDSAGSMDKVLRGLEAERQRVQDQADALVAQRRTLEKEMEAVASERQRIEDDGKRLVEESQADALREIADTRATIAQIVRELQQGGNARSVQRRRVKLAELEKGLGAGDKVVRPVPSSERPALSRAEARVGLSVYVPAFGRDGVITELRGNQAEVSVGSVRTRVSLASLRYTEKAVEARQNRSSASHDDREVALPPRSVDNTCDVRGTRVDEGWAKVERFLDQTLLQNRSVAFVLHGHGTGRLKTGLRERLKGSLYVRRIEAGAPEHGGDGVTVVWLK